MNELKVEGPAEEREKFRKAAVGHDDKADEEKEAKESVLDFEALRPTPSPEELAKSPDDEFNSHATNMLAGLLGKREKDWYTWRLANWGTKWRAGYAELREGSGDLLIYDFDTAWGPPSELFEYVSNLFPELTFTLRYGEGANDFQGHRVFKGGECIEHSEGSFVYADWGMEDPSKEEEAE
jgi:hypothetical protein